MPAASDDGTRRWRARLLGALERRTPLQETIDPIQFLPQLLPASRVRRGGRRLARQIVAELVLVDARFLLVERRGAIGRVVAVRRDAAGLGRRRDGEEKGGERRRAQRRSVLGV